MGAVHQFTRDPPLQHIMTIHSHAVSFNNIARSQTYTRHTVMHKTYRQCGRICVWVIHQQQQRSRRVIQALTIEYRAHSLERTL